MRVCCLLSAPCWQRRSARISPALSHTLCFYSFGLGFDMVSGLAKHSSKLLKSMQRRCRNKEKQHLVSRDQLRLRASGGREKVCCKGGAFASGTSIKPSIIFEQKVFLWHEAVLRLLGAQEYRLFRLEFQSWNLCLLHMNGSGLCRWSRVQLGDAPYCFKCT